LKKDAKHHNPNLIQICLISNVRSIIILALATMS